MYSSFNPIHYRSFGHSIRRADSNMAARRSSRSTPMSQKTKSGSHLRESFKRKNRRLIKASARSSIYSVKKFRHRNRSRSSVEDQKTRIKSSAKNRLGSSSSQKGFITLTGVSFLVLIFTLIGSFGVLSYVIKKKMTLSSHCVFQVLKLQKELAKPLTSLMKLNPQATRLRAQEALAKAQLAAAIATGTPPAIAAARARLLTVQQRQLVLKAKQELLLIEARVRREGFHNYWLPRTSRVKRKTRFPGQSPSLAVQPKPLGSRSPSYEPTSDFSKSQAQSYTIHQAVIVPGFQIFTWALDSKDLSISYHCSATLKKQGERKWIPILKEDKESWRSFYGYF